MPTACGAYPAVLNGVATVITNNAVVEYSCAPGFYMTGSKTVTCDVSTGWEWTAPPVCNVIDSNDQINIYGDNHDLPQLWLYLLAGLLGLLILGCLVALLCYFCCRPRGGGAIQPYHDDYGGGGRYCVCCGRRAHDVSMDEENCYYVIRTPSTDRSEKRGTRVNVSPSSTQNGDHGCKHSHNARPARPAKTVNAWMPHAKPIRCDHNTSTK